jgi:riboflavin kinase/FMN adenylyltransferase
MKIIDWPNFLLTTDSPKSAMTVGVFDGVHRGHRELLGLVLEKSAKTPCRSVVVTFSVHPRNVLGLETVVPLIPLEKKLRIFEGLGIDQTVLIDFSPQFSKLSGRDFLKSLRVHGNSDYMVIGEGFCCGQGNMTDAPAVKAINDEFGVETEIVREVMEEGRPVSSSRIRECLAKGNIALAQRMLGDSL